MPRLHYSARSRLDLESIWDFIANESPANADAVLLRLHERLEQLRLQPQIGHRRPELGRQFRCINSDGYVAIYRATATDVRVVRIVHHSRDFSILQLE